MPEQLTFDLPARTALGRSDFFISESNRIAVATVDLWPDWPSRKLLLIGPRGSGKSHLASVWASASGALELNVQEPLHAISGHAVLIEDIDQFVGSNGAETNLFHWHNHVLAEGGTFLMTASRLPAPDEFKLPDLASRVIGTPSVALDDPDDTLLQALLLKLFADRQLTPPATLLPWLLRRMTRSGEAAQKLVEALDQRSLATGRPIGQSLAAEILAEERQ